MRLTTRQLRQVIRQALTERHGGIARGISRLRDEMEDESIESEARLDVLEDRVKHLEAIIEMATTELDRAELAGMAPVSSRLRHMSHLGGERAQALSRGGVEE